MTSIQKTIPILAVLALISSCRQHTVVSGPETTLARMRADTAWIRQLDSLAQTAIGPGARCLDPVKHTFAYDGRTWLFNQDWGGVLEIPADYLPEDDLWQAGFSFHGTRVFSPDSLILISCYACLQTQEPGEYAASIRQNIEEQGFSIQAMTEEDGVWTLRARSAEGVSYYGRYLYCNSDGVEYVTSVQYPDNKQEEAAAIREMIDRFPAGPGGKVFQAAELGNK